MRIILTIILTIFFFSLRVQTLFAQPTNWGAKNYYASAETFDVAENGQPDKVHYIVADHQMAFSLQMESIMVLDDAAQKENQLVLQEEMPEEGTIIRIYNGDSEPVKFDRLELPADHETYVLYLFGQWHKAFKSQNGWEILE